MYTIKEWRKSIIIFDQTNALQKHMWQFKDFLDPDGYPRTQSCVLIDKEGTIRTQTEIDQFAIAPFSYAIYKWQNGKYEFVEQRTKVSTITRTDGKFPESLDPYAFPKGDEDIYISTSGERKSLDWFDYVEQHLPYGSYHWGWYKWVKGRYQLQEQYCIT